MKKIFLSVALLCAAMCMNAEKLQVIGRDTLAWNEGVELQVIKKVNDFGETRVSYKAILQVNVGDKDGVKKKERKVSISRKTYLALEQGAHPWIVLTYYDDGSEKITKVTTK